MNAEQPLPLAPRPVLHGLSPVAIVVGGLADILLSWLLGFLLALYVIVSRSLASLPKEQLQTTLLAAIHDSAALHSLQVGLGLVCSVLGGYVAAALAKQRRIVNGVLACWLCVGIGIFTQIEDTTAPAVAIRAGMIVLTPLCYAAGAWLRAKRAPAGPRA